MRRSLLLGTCGAALLAVTPFFSSAGEAMMHKLATEVSRLTETGETTPAEREETEFGRRLLEAWKKAGVKLPMPEEQIKRLHRGVKKLSTTPEVELPANMRFTGFLQYSNVDGEMWLPYGFYTFSQEDGFKRKLYKEMEACINLGGAYVDNRLYGLSSINNSSSVTFYQWDTDTWHLLADPVRYKYNLIALGGADLDPVSNNVYGITDGMMGVTTLSILDYANLDATEVGDLSPICSDIAAFAISNDGIGYAIDNNSGFFKIDLSTATPEKIGTIDFKMYYALQSMTFDRHTNKLYLVASEGDPEGGMYGRLCEVNLTDGSTKLIGYLPEAEEYTVLHIIYDPDADAPGTLTDLTATYTDASCNGVVSFTIPETTFGGSALTGDVNYAIHINDGETPVATGKGTAGEKISANVTAAEGRTKYVVLLSNEAGEGELNAIESWGGADTPAVTIANAEANGNNVTVSWETKGANGGYTDLNGVTYTISRFPGNVTIAEGLTENSFTDNISEEPSGAFIYSITPVKGDETYKEMKTSPVYGGTPRELPYSQDFETSDADYDFLMLNNHDAGWEIVLNEDVEGMMWYNASPYVDADSWALTPEMAFEEGYTYIIDFRMSKSFTNYSEYLGVGIGMGTDPTTYDTVMEKTAVEEIYYNNTNPVNLVYECKKTGAYRLGFHAMSPRNQLVIFIHEVSVVKGLLVNAPSACTEISAEAGAAGELTATISFKTPVATVGGTDLDKISKVSLYREGTEEAITELTDLIPGKEYSITDDDAMNGKMTYTLTAWNEFGEGEKASVSVYVGIDQPTAPKDITLKDNLDGSVTLSWEEESIGVNGALVDLDEVTYNVYYYNDGSLVKLADEIEDTTYTVKGIRTTGEQAFMFLFVSAANDLGESEATEAPVLTIGDPYTVPFMEGFEDLAGIWMPEGESVSWGLYSGMSADGDNYIMGAAAESDNATGVLRSGKFSFKGVKNPKIVFSFYGIPGADNTLSLSVCRDGGEAEEALSIPFATLDGDPGWRTCLVDLSKYSDATYVTFIFGVNINDDNYGFMYFDDVNVRDVPEHNLSVTVTPSNRATAGKDARIDVSLHNVGTSIENNYKVEIYADDVLQTTLDAIEIYPFERAKISSKYTVPVLSPEISNIKAVLIDPADSIADDNTSEGSIKVVKPLLEEASNLNADNANETVTLTWEAPENSSAVTDSFEGYESFLYDGFGDWKVIDADDSNTIPVINNYYPGNGNKAAFFTVDFSSLGYDVVANPNFAGHTGESFIACVRPNNYESDDWVISPELSGNAQTISLFAKNIGATYDDIFEILYSEGGLNIEDFVSTGMQCETDDSWQEFTAELPAGAKYFAIHCTSYIGGMLMIDDVTYEAATRELVGYNIYRNNELIATVDANTLTYSEAAPAGDASYVVTALYNVGESAPCDKVSVTSVAMIEAIGVSMSAKNGMITVEGADGYEVNIVALDGKVLFNGTAGGTITLPVAKGLYIVTVGDTSAKLLAD